eukprot:TRINITY_DN4986_c0_g1_i4.p2 TRINITY_DN4986_c0_g1~~TRINITY_DN4986_c0_g1_i4.p2  ORF type:complete len:160 (+),score=28.98 TRINITY_DN4986_c0_g1_i4:3-482(+)
MPVGTPITVRHFVPGQYIDVRGVTIGKGFQGVMKRHGFAGGPASHGNSKAHRKAGSTGQCQDPGKVFKGKKMAGHMGAERRTVQNVWVYRIDPHRNLMYIRGQIPGHKGSFVVIQDALRKPKDTTWPFPTHFADPNEDLEALLQPVIAAPGTVDPFACD